MMPFRRDGTRRVDAPNDEVSADGERGRQKQDLGTFRPRAALLIWLKVGPQLCALLPG
jgi:hypothetical protein